MNCIEKLCPACFTNCIRVTCVYFSKKMGTKKKSYQGLNELQQEQFKFKERAQKKRIFNQNISSSDIRNSIQQPSKINLNDSVGPQKLDVQMEVKLMLNQNENDIKNTSNKSFNSMNILQEQKNNNQDLPIIQNHHKKFKINIDPFNKYYQIISNRTKDLNQLFNTKGQQVKLGESMSNFYAQQIESNDGQTYVFNYKLPCSYSFYSNMNNNHSEAIFQGFNPIIQQYKLFESIQNNLKVNYLSLNKFMILEPRQFTYVKYSYGINNQHWEVCLTLENQDQYKNQKPKNDKTNSKKISGDFFIVSYLRQDNLEGSPQINVKTYCWIDIKSTIKTAKFITRGLSEVKNYIQKLHQHCQSSFQQELA